MNNFFPVRACGSFRIPRAPSLCGLAVLVFVCLAAPDAARAQASESANAGHGLFSIGGGGSGVLLQYGQRKMIGATAWGDIDTIRRIGIEAEVRWVDFQQTANVHAETYLGGARYHFNFRRMQPYVKGMAGFGRFNFPYNFATGNYLVVAGGGGIDYRLNRKWGFRADFEYQYWPQFTYGAMSSPNVTLGLRYHIR